MENNVFIAVPTHNGDIRGEVAASVLQASTQSKIAYCHQKLSNLTRNFNSLLCMALNGKIFSHFCMIHGDVITRDAGWLGKMLAIMQETCADILSVILPIKGQKGLTSTGYCKEETVPLTIKRLTMKEVFALPETFAHEHLVVNTGLMLINLQAPFMSHVGRGLCFRVTDQIVYDKGGKLQTVGSPEDWLWSLDARGLGAKIYATRAIKADHCGGSMMYPNHEPFGVDSEDYHLS